MKPLRQIPTEECKKLIPQRCLFNLQGYLN